MSISNGTKLPCSICNSGDDSPRICSGCDKLFCCKHIDKHRDELQQQVDKMSHEYHSFKKKLDPSEVNKTLLAKIDEWEKEFIRNVKHNAEEARKELRKLTEHSNDRWSHWSRQLTEKISSAKKNTNITEKELNTLVQQFEDYQKELKKLSDIKLVKNDGTPPPLIQIKRSNTNEKESAIPSNERIPSTDPNQVNTPAKPSQNDNSATNRSEVSPKLKLHTTQQSSAYPSFTFGLNESTNIDIERLFKKLMLLPPMDKNGPMSGKCSIQTDQMERFLQQTFGFQNIPEQYIVQGVRSFYLTKSPHSLSSNAEIYFPHKSANSFAMTVQEILDWQRSYKVYADKKIQGMTKEFLCQALQGQSRDGDEAFRMKFVVRISTCPILMEFDAKTIQRSLNDDWPNRIKLVSVTGIDFAGREHDVGDIIHYIKNWKEVFELDQRKNQPALLNDRDFAKRRGGPAAELSQGRLLNDLMLMARLRLRACDMEGVQVAVETGIGLGVFAGKHIGIDKTVRITSAMAIRTVLEEEGSSYKHIRAVVFALPVFDTSGSDHVEDSFDNFAEYFHEPKYTGCIPVLIADQDMHRLTVAIARQGFIVSELNPADSHGVFGEYWQNKGPAVEEKLALTTVGLLVQHHLINPHVLKPENYHLI